MYSGYYGHIACNIKVDHFINKLIVDNTAHILIGIYLLYYKCCRVSYYTIVIVISTLDILKYV